MGVQPAIFVVDDDAGSREFVRALLEFAGLGDIRPYETSRRFLDEATVRDGDVVLLEQRLPEIDGIAVQRELNRRGNLIAVIMMTANPAVPIVVKAMQAGAADFIEKPFSNEALVGGVQRALAVAQRRDRGVARSDDMLRRLDTLTGREREVFDRLVQGWSNKTVALDLKISQRTVEMHRARVMAKMQVINLATLIRMTVDIGLRPEVK